MGYPENQTGGHRHRSVPELNQEIIIQRKIAQDSLQFLEERFSDEKSSNEYLNILYEKLKIEQNFFSKEFEEIKELGTKENALNNYQNIYLQLLDQQRKLLNKMNQHADCDEELIRKYLALIDLEELKIREKLIQPNS